MFNTKFLSVRQLSFLTGMLCYEAKSSYIDKYYWFFCKKIEMDVKVQEVKDSNET